MFDEEHTPRVGPNGKRPFRIEIWSTTVVVLLLFGCLSGCSLTPWREGKHTEKGKASWYGNEYHGRPTASGETFNQNDLTAAHAKYPFGTLVRVKNLNNGKTVDVRINDRGPTRRGRIIDLSRAAAQQIDMIPAGVVPVRIEVLRWGRGGGKSSR